MKTQETQPIQTWEGPKFLFPRPDLLTYKGDTMCYQMEEAFHQGEVLVEEDRVELEALLTPVAFLLRW